MGLLCGPSCLAGFLLCLHLASGVFQKFRGWGSSRGGSAVRVLSGGGGSMEVEVLAGLASPRPLHLDHAAPPVHPRPARGGCGHSVERPPPPASVALLPGHRRRPSPSRRGKRRLLREAGTDRGGHIRVRVYRPRNLDSPIPRDTSAWLQFSPIVAVIRQVYMAKETETKEIVALKKIRMDNEREDVSILVLFRGPSFFFKMSWL